MMTRRQSWACACLAVGATLAAEAQDVSRAREPWRAPSAAVAKKQENAFRSGGLKAAAKISGFYMRTIDVAGTSFPETTAELVRRSSVIVIGSSMTNVSKIDRTGRRVFTHYSVTSSRILKGSVKDTVVVAVEGGRVSFRDDSTAAQVNVRGARKPRNAVNYLWFLRRAPSDVSSDRVTPYVPVGDVLGVFEVVGDPEHQRVAPAGRLDLPLLRRVASSRMSMESFVTTITETLRH